LNTENKPFSFIRTRFDNDLFKHFADIYLSNSSNTLYSDISNVIDDVKQKINDDFKEQVNPDVPLFLLNNNNVNLYHFPFLLQQIKEIVENHENNIKGSHNIKLDNNNKLELNKNYPNIHLLQFILKEDERNLVEIMKKLEISGYGDPLGWVHILPEYLHELGLNKLQIKKWKLYFKHMEPQVLNIQSITGDFVGRDQYNITHIHNYSQMMESPTINILEDLGLHQFIPQFQKSGLTNPYNFASLTDNKLKSMGFGIGHIFKWRNRYPLPENIIDEVSDEVGVN
jgi:hypothetical protein